MKETSRIQSAIAKGKLTDDDNVMNWILNQVILFLVFLFFTSSLVLSSFFKVFMLC